MKKLNVLTIGFLLMAFLVGGCKKDDEKLTINDQYMRVSIDGVNSYSADYFNYSPQ